MTTSLIPFLPGGQDLIDWFGRVPRFHDAELQALSLAPGARCKLTLEAWNMTDQVGSDGFYITDRHAVVAITINHVTGVSLYDVSDARKAVIDRLEINGQEPEVTVTWEAHRGVYGTIIGRGVTVSVTPLQR